MRYMIHACPKRMWYVEDFLIPSMEAQGIPRNQIDVWNDTDGVGNLMSFMNSCKSLDGSFDSHWHLQDDVVLSKSFRDRAEFYSTEGIVAGFCHKGWDDPKQTGYVHPANMWLAFQCLHIPDVYASECADWFFRYAVTMPDLKEKIQGGKDDDVIWRRFVRDRHSDIWTMNLFPAMVDHVDYLIGGTTINFERPGEVHRAYYWEEEDVIKDLEDRLKVYGGKRHGIDRPEQSAKSAELSKSADDCKPDLRVGQRTGGGRAASSPGKYVGDYHGPE